MKSPADSDKSITRSRIAINIFREKGFAALLAEGAEFVLRRLFERLWLRQFHQVWYNSKIWAHVYWLGISILQNPMDMWVLQEIIAERKPDFIVETGTYEGGSALFFSNVFDLVGHGRVITIDAVDRCRVSHPRIVRITGSSVSDETVSKVREIVGNSRSVVFLDSAHNKHHVLQEMELYHQLVKPGDYLIVADTNVNGHPVLHGYREVVNGEVYHAGPMDAVKEFLKNHPEFRADKSKEKNLFTQFPNGFLLRCM